MTLNRSLSVVKSGCLKNAKADRVPRASCADFTFDPSRATRTRAPCFGWHETASEANCKFYNVVHTIREEMRDQHSRVALAIVALDFFVEVLGSGSQGAGNAPCSCGSVKH